MTETVAKKKGKKGSFETKAQIAQFLNSILDTGVQRNGGSLSYYHIRKLRIDGWLEPVTADEKKDRGRYKNVYRVTGKGRSLVGAFKGAAKARANRVAPAEASVA